MISGRTYCTFAALCSPTAPAISRSKQAIQKPMLPGFPSAVSASAASPTATPGGKDKPVLFFHVVFSFLRYSDMRIAQENKKVNLICMAKWQFLQKTVRAEGSPLPAPGKI